ncbi:deoxycytidylate deaminase [Plantactinospora solaniradicis]|uniref:Deoxycytidylate deaminase n=1 Tax=Plantactinospora solaniradicis TaxID=1723736 RepID=A0ABW1KJV3_9ACTN
MTPGSEKSSPQKVVAITRPSLHETLMTVAEAYALRGTCSRLQVGAVIADSRGVVLSSGYNGAPAGMPHCDHTDSSEPCRLSVHAEINALLWAARRGVATEGSCVYVTHEPCYNCSLALIQAGITEVRYRYSYGRNSGVPLLIGASIDVSSVSLVGAE